MIWQKEKNRVVITVHRSTYFSNIYNLWKSKNNKVKLMASGSCQEMLKMAKRKEV